MMSNVPSNAGGAPVSAMSPRMQYERTQLYLARAKLKASSRTSALLSGFAMVAMVELDIKDTIPSGLLISFSVCTVILVSVHLLALMISTCLLPHVEVAAGTIQDTSANMPLLPQQVNFEEQSNDMAGDKYDRGLFQPHLHMRWYIEMAWMCSTVFGIILFLLEIGLIVWVQFSSTAAYVATCVLVPIILLFIAVIFKFYHRVVNSRMKFLRHMISQSSHGFTEHDEHSVSSPQTEDGGGRNGIHIV